jgi:hypothetical protein
MLSFKTFMRVIEEALDVKRKGPGMANRGANATRHIGKYIVPHVGSSEGDTHTLRTKAAGMQAGTHVAVHGYEVHDDGSHHAIVSHNGKEHVKVPFSKLHRLATSYDYNDEHATAHMWNHAVKHGIAHDTNAMHNEIEKAKKDKNHPLSFYHKDLTDTGFSGGKKTEKHKESYYKELETAAHTVSALAHHPNFKEAVKQQHHAKVMGAERGKLSELWKSHGARENSPAAISKSDMAIGPKNKEHQGIKISLKRGGGSQLASPGPEEMAAMHEHAANEMLRDHPKYKNLSAGEKKAHKKSIMDRIGRVKEHMDAARGKDDEGKKHHISESNKILSSVHEDHPHLNHYLRKEATSGRGKFTEGSGHVAEHLVVGASGKHKAQVKHVDDVDHSGSAPFISRGKGGKASNPLTMRLTDK